MPNKEWPRVLIVNGDPIFRGSATGLTLHSLFDGWPAERLACLYFANATPTPGVCGTTWRLGAEDIPLARAIYGTLASLSRLRRRPSPDRSLDDGVSDGGQAVASPRDRELPWAVRGIRNLARSQEFAQLAHYRIPRTVKEQMRDFGPDLLYTMLGSNLVSRVVVEVQNELKVPVVPHVMDDWLGGAYMRSVFRPLLRARMRRDWRRAFARSPIKLAIGEAMAAEYSRRFGGEFTPFMNAVEPEYLVPSAPRQLDGSPYRLVYVGGLHLNRWRSLREVGLALALLAREGLRAELLVYAHARYKADAKKMAVPGITRFMGPIGHSEVPRTLREADVLLHVESFDRASRTYTRYSVSTKIPEYMGARRPILAYGPHELASIRYVEESGSGMSVGRRDPGALVAALRTLLESAGVRERLGSRGFTVATTSHDAARQRERFRVILAEAAAVRMGSGP